MKFPRIQVSTSLLFKIVGSFFLLAGFTVGKPLTSPFILEQCCCSALPINHH
jgi:hypothetical protein